VTNGAFDSSSGWTVDNWSISDGKATYANYQCGNGGGTLEQDVSVGEGKMYKLTFSIKRWDEEYSDGYGAMSVSLGGNQLAILERSGTGTYSYTTTASGTGNLIFAATTGSGSDCLLEIDLDDVSVKEKTAQYTYDYLGRRVSKTLHASQTTIHYAYDGDQIVAEYDGNGTLLRKFIYGPGIDEPICMIDVVNDNAKYYYHFDGLGSVVALSDESGNIVERYSYDVFGEPNRVSAVSNRYMFTGREYDSETGNYYYRARYYKPDIGRFMSADPIGYEAGLNLYTYVANNPINNIDPLGLVTYDECLSHYQTALKKIREYVVDCQKNYCGSLNPVDWDLLACAAACGKFSGLAFGACWTGCVSTTAAARGACHVMCAAHGRQMERNAREVSNRCWRNACYNE